MKIGLKKSLVLASASEIRRNLLEQAGIFAEIHPVDLDEETIRQSEIEKGTSIGHIARKLAEAKAYEAGIRLPSDRVILAADQILELEGKIFSKPETMEQAMTHLKSLRGKTHFLHTSVALYEKGKLIWSHLMTSELIMRNFSDHFIKQYVQSEGENVLQSVGAYRIEALGIHLFSHIKGERDAILGLPMLPLLEALRHFGILSDNFD